MLLTPALLLRDDDDDDDDDDESWARRAGVFGHAFVDTASTPRPTTIPAAYAAVRHTLRPALNASSASVEVRASAAVGAALPCTHGDVLKRVAAAGRSTGTCTYMARHDPPETNQSIRRDLSYHTLSLQCDNTAKKESTMRSTGAFTYNM